MFKSKRSIKMFKFIAQHEDGFSENQMLSMLRNSGMSISKEQFRNFRLMFFIHGQRILRNIERGIE